MNEYKKVRLGDVCEKGSSNIAQNEILENEGNYPIYGAAGFIKNVDFYKQEEPYIGIVKDGAGVGRVSVHPAKSSLIGTMQYIFPKENIEIGYLAAYLKSQNLGSLYKGAAIPHIYFKDYENFQIPLPPKETQKQIASSLDKVTKIITENKTLLEKYDLLIKSRFIEMFGDPLDNQKNWEVQTLGNLCEIVRGGSPRPIDKFLGGSIPWIKIGDATNGDDIYLYKTKEHIIEEGIKKSRLIPEGSLIFANCGVSLGFARIIKFQGCIHDGWLAFQNISPRVNNVFLLKSLNMCTDYFRKTAPDGTQPNLNTTIMKSFVQILPPKDLQDEYVQFVQQIDKSKFVVQKSLEKAETLYKSLMQEYFG